MRLSTTSSPCQSLSLQQLDGTQQATGGIPMVVQEFDASEVTEEAGVILAGVAPVTGSET